MFSDREQASAQRRDFLKRLLEGAYYQAHGAESGSDLRKANDILQEVLEKMKDKSERMLREDHEECWQRWLEVKEAARWKRKEICDFNYGYFRNEACKAKGWAEELPKDAKQKVREVQQAMKGRTMEGWQFDEIRGILDDAYRTAGGVLQRRHEEWRARMESAKSRKLELLEKNRSIITNIEQQIDRCQDMLREARSSEHQYRVQGWIDEKYSKIRDIERFNRELEDQIRDIDSKAD
jgi:aminoglycoside phosphotransferase family enzyme